MRNALRWTWDLLTTPVSGVADVVCAWWLRRRGWDVIDNEALSEARERISASLEYIDKSGHLNTVKGRRPRAVDRLVRTLWRALVRSSPARPVLGKGS